MRETKEALENSSMGLEVLQDGTGKLGFNLSLLRTSINRTLSDPGCHDEESDATTAQLCRNIRQSLSQLQISANFTRVRNLNEAHLAAEMQTWMQFKTAFLEKITTDCVNAVEWFSVMMFTPTLNCLISPINACCRSLKI